MYLEQIARLKEQEDINLILKWNINIKTALRAFQDDLKPDLEKGRAEWEEMDPNIAYDYLIQIINKAAMKIMGEKKGYRKKTSLGLVKNSEMK